MMASTDPVVSGRKRVLRVLVVEDEPRLRDLMTASLPEMGFEPASARNGEDALRMMRNDPREIVILDLQLPLMSGMEVFEKIKAEWPATQVIVLTGFGNLATARRAIQLEVVDFLTKPCHLSELEAALQRARRRYTATPAPDSSAAPELEALTLAQSEYRQIVAALRRHNGNRTVAAQELGISRRTLHYRLAEYQTLGYPID